MTSKKSPPVPKIHSKYLPEKEPETVPEWLSELISVDLTYSVKTLSKIFENSKSFWRKRIAKGDIKCGKPGRSVRIPGIEIIKFILKFSNNNASEMGKIPSKR